MKKFLGFSWGTGLLLLAAMFAPATGSAAVSSAARPWVAAGDRGPTSIDVSIPGKGTVALKATPVPNQIEAGGCTFTVLPNDNSTSGNERAPTLRNRFGRSIYLITASELAANGLVSGSIPTGIGWNYQTAQGLTGSGPLIVYLQNTSDVTNNKSTTWSTAITGMTIVHNATTTLPSAAGPFDITFSGGSPLTYTGGGLYVAFDMQYPVGTLSATTVVWCNSTGLANGLLGAQGAAAPTTLAASPFRPETRFTAPVVANDASVDVVVNYGVVPLGLTSPLAIQAVVTNKGQNTLTNLPVTLTVSGAESFTDTQTIASLASCGGQTTVTFAPFTPSLQGNDVATVTVPADDVPANNSNSKPFTVGIPNFSYKYPGSTAGGGVGLTGAVGAFMARFKTAVATNVTQVTPEFAAASATTYKVAIYADGGTGTPGNLLYLDAANRTVSAAGPVTITLPTPVAVGPGNFFVGIQQTNTTNASLAFDTEAPIRGGAFFLAGQLPPTTWVDFFPGNNFKLDIGITLDRCNIAPTASNNGPICNGATLQLASSAAGAASYSWTGPGGYTSNLQNPSIPNAGPANSGSYTVKVNGCASGTSTNAVVNGPYTVTASTGPGGGISPVGAVSVNCGASQTFNFMANPCFSVADVLVDGVSVGAPALYTFSNVSANHTISVSFSQDTYTIVASAGTGGSISPSGSTVVGCGNNQLYAITPTGGYQIDDVKVDGGSVGAVASYTFSSVSANHTIAASFSLISATIAAQSTGTFICPTNACVTIPVNLTRVYTNGVLAFSVSFQLSPNLSLCSGTSSITEGTFLNSTGSTLFNVVDNGGGSYTVDCAVVGTGCGPMTSNGNLFNIAVTSSAPGGSGTITLSTVKMRDCANAPLAVSAGAPATVPIDNQAPVVVVTSPNGGEVWPLGSVHAIGWTATDNTGVASVDIAWSTDGGVTYPNVIATGAPNTGSYTWTAQPPETNQARVRVTAHDVACSSTSDASDANFTVGAYAITASAGAGGTINPNGAVTVPYGANQAFTIAPSSGYQIADVLVDGSSVGPVANYTFNNVIADHTIAASFSLIPAYIQAQSTATYLCPSNTCVTMPVELFRQYTNPVLAYSVTFKLSPELTLCSGTGSITEGTFLSSSGPTSYQVINNGGGSYTVDDAVLGAGCGPTGTNGVLFNVAVASSVPGGTGSVTVTSTTLRDCSNDPLPVVPGIPGTVPIDNEAPIVTVTSPNGGESWLIGSSQSITWTATDNTGVANVDLAYSTDGGTTFPNVIATGVPNTGAFGWTVPNTPTALARVRVTAHDIVCSSSSDASDANFTIRDPVITASAGPGGSISPSGAVSVPSGTNQTFAISPADACHAIADVLVDGVSVGAVASYTFTSVTVDHTIAASFTLLGPYAITAAANPPAGGAVTGPASVACGGSATYTITTNSCYTLTGVDVDGVDQGPITTYTFTNVHAPHTITANFTANSPYTITATAVPAAGGTVTGPATVPCGGSATYTIAADPCYHVTDVKVDNVSVGVVPSYTFSNVQANHTIEADFAINTYTLTVPIVGSGTVTKFPDQATYDCGTKVILTAVPAATWAFTGWSGDVTSTTNPLSVVMDGNKTITATFEMATAVVVSMFEAETVNEGVTLRWKFSDATDLVASAIERAETVAGPWIRVTGDAQDVSGVETITDHAVQADHDYVYRLMATVTGGRSVALTAITGKAGAMVTESKLAKVWPNPTTDFARIDYTVAREMRVQVTIIDLQGRTVAALFDGVQRPGRYQASWNTNAGHRIPSGVYFVRYQAPGITQVRRVLLAR